jgi:hypothetical protein
MGTFKSQRTILSEDGELLPVDAESESETASPDAVPSAVFCCNCGTANQARSQFCRMCGQSLDEQMLNPASLDQYAPPQSKNKRFVDLIAQAGQRTPDDKAATREGSVLFFLAILAAVSIAAHEIWLALLILLIFTVIVVSRRWVSSGH